jgi:cell division protein FtsW
MNRRWIHILVFAVVGMVMLGLVMLYSTSAFARDSHGDPHYFLKRQAVWLAIGFIGCCAAARLDYHRLQKWWLPLLIVSAVLLALCFVPPFRTRINGSSRWINLGALNFQPSELGKLAAVVFLAWWFSKYESRSKEFLKGLVMPCAIVGALLVLIAAEVDIGTTSLICGTMYLMLFVAGVRIIYLAVIALLGAGGLTGMICLMPERTGRFLAFLYPEKYPADAYQAQQGLIALGSGGFDGLGLGNGRQKMLYLPYAHTDFIFPMIGEELGLRFTLLVVLAYVLIIFCGAAIAIQSRDRFGLLLGVGVVSLIGLQAAVNIGVTTELLPNKGLPLPFVSYGGSNLAFCLLALGILISIHRQGNIQPRGMTLARLNSRVTPRI